MNRACHHARVVDSRRARLLSFHHPPYLLHDAVLSVVEVAVNVEWVELVADADRELVGEHIAGRSKRDLCRRAAHLHDPRRRVRLLCTRRQHHAAHEPSWTELDSTGLDWSSQTGVLNTCFPMAVFTAHELTMSTNRPDFTTANQVVTRCPMNVSCNWVDLLQASWVQCSCAVNEPQQFIHLSSCHDKLTARTIDYHC